MSYILEALKKSEQERQLGHVPEFSQTQETPKLAAPRWPRWLLLALLVNALILVVLAWRMWGTQTQSAVVVAPPAVVAPTSVTPASVARAPEPDIAAPVLPVPPSPLAPPVPSVQSPVAEDTSQVTVSPPVVDESAAAGPPRWDDLPLDERAQLPAPRIDVHVFAQEPERRFVLINLHKFRVGDRLDEGPTLVAIVNDGIVLSYAGREYRVDRP